MPFNTSRVVFLVLIASLCRARVDIEFFSSKTVPNELKSLLEFLKVEHDKEQDSLRLETVEAGWDVFNHPQNPDSMIVYSHRYLYPEDKPFLKNWLKIYNRQNPEDPPAVPQIFRVVIVRDSTEQNCMTAIFFKKIGHMFTEEFELNSKMSSYYDEPLNFFSIYLQMFEAYLRVIQTGVHDSLLDIDSFSFYKIESASNFPKYGVLFSNMSDLTLLSIKKKGAYLHKLDPIRITGAVINANFADRVDLFSLAIDILNFEAKRFSQMYETPGNSRLQIKIENPYPIGDSSKSAFYQEMSAYYRDFYTPIYRHPDLQAALSKVRKNKGNLKLGFSNSKPIKALSLGFLSEAIQMILLVQNHGKIKSNFDYISLQTDFIYLAECLTVIYKYHHRHLKNQTLTLKKSNNTQVKIDFLDTLTDLYRNFLMGLAAVMQRDYKSRPNIAKIRDDLAIYNLNVQSLYKAHQKTRLEKFRLV